MRKFEKRERKPDLIPEGLIDDLVKFHEEDPDIEKTLKMVCIGYQELIVGITRDYNDVVEEYDKVCKMHEELKKHLN